tara:strand:+ start:836 stop:1162 length:327 start_codon:yes stop_codon:yes gene_type:complete
VAEPNDKKIRRTSNIKFFKSKILKSVSEHDFEPKNHQILVCGSHFVTLKKPSKKAARNQQKTRKKSRKKNTSKLGTKAAKKPPHSTASGAACIFCAVIPDPGSGPGLF